VTIDIRFSVLGPVQAWRGETEIELGSPQQRAVLAMLLLRAGTLTTLDEMVDAIWGADTPRTAGGTVRTYISRLRRILDPDGTGAVTIASLSGGYTLRVPAESTDLGRFRRHVARAQTARQRGDLGAASTALREALGLWRGTALAGLPGSFAAAHRERLGELRIATLSDRIGADLALGRHAELTIELSTLVAALPLRESLREHYMLALYGAGRQADALATFREFRRRLAEELQIGPGAELQRLHQRILAADPALLPEVEPEPVAAPLVPTQLPPGTSDFTGRDAELAEITGLLARSGEVPVVAVTGMGGVGKTAVAVRAAHAVRAAFPDGQLYANLGATTDRPADPFVVLGGFLRAYGVPDEQLPELRSDRVALWRTLAAGRRILLLLDDARDSAQLRDLLPATAGCAAVVTSRRRVLDLPGSRWIKLDPLSSAEALTLLERVVGARRVHGERDAAQLLLARCSYLPHAVRLVGARLVARQHWTMTDVGRRIDEEMRLACAPVAECGVASTPFEWGYRQLPAAQARAFRLLALPDGPDIGVVEGAAMLEQSESEVETILESLADVHLVEAGRRGRYRYVGLIKSFARHRAEVEDGAVACAEALTRMRRAGELLPAALS